MKPIKFKESNVVYGEGQEKFLPLPARLEDGPEGIVITKWRLSFVERIRVLFTGRIWLSQMSFRHPLQPQFPTTKKSDFFEGKTLAASLRGFKKAVLKSIGIVSIVCSVMILTACDGVKIEEGYIVDMKFNPKHTRTTYNVALKQPTVQSVPDTYTLWVANRRGGIRITVEKEVYEKLSKGQYINLKDIDK